MIYENVYMFDFRNAVRIQGPEIDKIHAEILAELSSDDFKGSSIARGIGDVYVLGFITREPGPVIRIKVFIGGHKEYKYEPVNNSNT